MREIKNWEEVKENTGDFRRPEVGGYIGIIKGVKDEEDKEYLRLAIDIADGEFKDYYTELYEDLDDDKKFWGLTAFASYKDKAAGFFKHFIKCIEESNRNFNWNWDEKKLKGKKIGIVLREEEYLSKDNDIRTSMRINNFETIETIKSKSYKIPELKKLSDDERKKANSKDKNNNEYFDIQSVEVDEDDLQF